MAENHPTEATARGLLSKLESLSLDPSETAMLKELIEAGRGVLTGAGTGEVEGFAFRTPSSSWILFFDEADAILGRPSIPARPASTRPERPTGR
ncbi:MAG TPA: hypothetical protein ENI86_07495 [Acidimicrobiales bacterium]|nr:hypothetical protein [Acidimicrobiales bacterium]